MGTAFHLIRQPSGLPPSPQGEGLLHSRNILTSARRRAGGFLRGSPRERELAFPLKPASFSSLSCRDKKERWCSAQRIQILHDCRWQSYPSSIRRRHSADSSCGGNHSATLSAGGTQPPSFPPRLAECCQLPTSSAPAGHLPLQGKAFLLRIGSRNTQPAARRRAGGFLRGSRRERELALAP